MQMRERKSVNRDTATWIALMTACAFPSTVLALLHPLSGTWTLPAIAGSFLVFGFFSAVATFVFGVPTYLLLRRATLIRWWSSPIAGFIDGALMAFAVTLP